MTNTNKTVLAIFSTIGLIVMGLAVYCLYIVRAISIFPEITYTKKDLIDNYIKREHQVKEAKRYFNSIVPTNKQIEIEFESDKKLFRFGVYKIEDVDSRNFSQSFLEWNLDVNSLKVDSIISSIGWTHKTLQTLKQKLDDAHCIQIKSGEPARIGFQRSGLGMYFYNIFDVPISDSLKREFDKGCAYKYYNRELILEYGGGAIGSSCFPQE